MGFLSSAVTVVESLQDLSLAVELTRVGVLTERNSPLDFELAVGPAERTKQIRPGASVVRPKQL